MDIDITNLGAIKQERKESDFDLNQIGSATEIPESYNTPYTGTIYHQRKIPACGSHTGAYVKNIHEGKDHSPAYLWKRIKQLDGYPPEAGTSMEGIFKALQKYGVCELSLMPNDTTVSIAKYTDPSTITPEMDKNAATSRIGAYGYDWEPTFDKIKRYIYQFKVVLVRIEISADWWKPSWKGKDILPLKKNYDGQGGHFVVLTGYDKDKIYGINMWSKDWGNNGFLEFTEDYMSRITYTGTCFDIVEQAPTIFTRTLKVGMKGTDVGVLQQILKDKGYFPKTQKITSYFGGITFGAVLQFQKDNGLIEDGIVGKLTQKLLTT